MKIVAITLLSVCLSMPVVLAQDGDDWIEDLNTLNAQQEAWNNAWEARQDRYQRQREESQRTHDRYIQYWEDLAYPSEMPLRPESDNPALDKQMREWDREQERATLRALEQRAQQEMMRDHAYSACGSIWNNPAAREECRRNRGGW